MTIRQVITVKPTSEPISLDLAKSHLKVETNEDDDLIIILIEVVRKWAEGTLNRALISQTWNYFINRFVDKIPLPKGPVISITQIDYIDTDGVTQTLSSSIYDADVNGIDGFVRRAYNQVWPSIRNTHNAITITYVVGYGTKSSDIEKPIIQGMLIYLADLYENRESFIQGGVVNNAPFSADALLAPYRVMSFA